MNIAIVTGASSGMGREFVLQLSQYVQVDEIWAIARRQEALETLKAETGLPVRPVCLDLCREESFEALKADGTVSGGMIPKIENALEAVKAGVKQVIITKADAIDGTQGTIIS